MSDKPEMMKAIEPGGALYDAFSPGRGPWRPITTKDSRPMSEPKEKKPRGPKRSKDEIAAEHKAWLMRHEWAGPKDALDVVRDVAETLEGAHAAAGDKIQPELWKAAQLALGAIDNALAKAIPQEAR